MLAKSFLHFPGIGPKRERELWRSGIYSWDEFFSRGTRQLHLFPELGESPGNPLAAESERALASGDTSFFARLLPKSEHYRIAAAFPSETLFLDIETTGLSRYYNEITLLGWSMGGAYKALIQGEAIDGLLEDLAEAKAIVTFNGTLFDLPFILDAWPEAPIPDAHVDLRFLCKRVGLTGGQKEIEKEIGKTRAADIRDMQGEAAPLLWYRYRHGDSSALKKLIEYNHADVEGMKRIFDVAVKKLCHDNQVPVRARPEEKFSRYRSKLTWASNNGTTRPGIRIRPYAGSVGPSLRYEDLAPSLGSEELRLVGIDLSGGEARHSGWCLLEGNRATTGRLYTDSEILRETVEARPHLVSIDSPLSLPEGRVSVSDDDPGREKYGILRRCERTLKKRGVNVYPCLLPSMQNLTARGIRLAKEFRAMGIPVIESYPGAAQDIMDIPRKGQSVELLAFGLRAFGIQGSFVEEKVSHDELDAITSAIVGLFFWSGRFEGLGDEIEEYLIIPDLKIDPTPWQQRRIIGLSGPIAAGKTTAARQLEKQGYCYGRFSQVLEEMLREQGKESTREALQRLGQEVNQKQGQRWLARRLLERLGPAPRIVVDGLRHPEDHAFLVETFGPAFLHIHVASELARRCDRYIAIGRSEKEFRKAAQHPVERNVPKLRAMANAVVENDADINALFESIAQVASTNMVRR